MKSAIERTKSEHAHDLMSGLKLTREEQFASDFKINVSDEAFPVHRNVLVSCSNYFKALFKSEMIETRKEYIDMKESDPDAVKQCIDFMYTGEANITLENVESILHEATLMELTRLRSLCSIFLRENVNVENCIQFREITQKKWKVVKLWIKGNAENEETIQTHLKDLMDVSQYPVGFLLDKVLKDSLVQSCKQVHKMVADAVFKDAKKLSKLISTQNCISIKDLVREYSPTNMAEINEAADKYIRKHFNQVSDTLEQ
uniref:kelch-like protein 21 n=1 Tax=Styela clava TaxID=7725 RepID=UPI001939CF7F|nr:kelch-like protein 21 [Styela clava]